MEAGRIEWDDGLVPILSRFWHVDFLDDLWRGTTVIFAPSSLGFDPVSWWHMRSFLADLTPVYTVWILESCRSSNAYTPAYL